MFIIFVKSAASTQYFDQNVHNVNYDRNTEHLDKCYLAVNNEDLYYILRYHYI